MQGQTFSVDELAESLINLDLQEHQVNKSDAKDNLIDFLVNFTPNQYGSVRCPNKIGIMAACILLCPRTTDDQTAEVLFEVLAQGRDELYYQKDEVIMTVFRSMIEFACIHWKRYQERVGNE